MKQKLNFKPAMTGRAAVTGNLAFEKALAVSDRFTIIETATTIIFKFQKRRPARAMLRLPSRQAMAARRRRRTDQRSIDLVQIQGGPD